MKYAEKKRRSSTAALDWLDLRLAINDDHRSRMMAAGLDPITRPFRKIQLRRSFYIVYEGDTR